MTTRTDDFNRTDGALGSNWTTYVGSGCTIVSNAVRANGTGASHGSYWSADSFGADQFCEVTLTSDLIQSLSQNYLSLAVRASGSGGTRNLYQFTVTNDHYYVSKVVNGTGTDIVDAAGTFASGDVIRIEVTGTSTTTIKAFKNGTQVGSDVTDSSSPHTSGAPGFEIYNSSAFYSTWDDWDGGDLGASQSQAPRTIIGSRFMRSN